MQCEEIMRPPVARLGADTSVASIALMMRDERVGLLPICDDAGVVVGVVSDRDVAVRLCARCRSPMETRVGEIMSSPAITCRPEDDIQVAEDLMLQHQKSRVVLTDADGRLRGIISLTDLAQHEQPIRMAQLLRQISAREYRVLAPHDV